MKILYLVCTRAAMSGSALTFMINQSRDFYNVTHEDLWNIEISDHFGEAHIINDWWNIPMQFKPFYTHDIRNTQQLTLEQIQYISDGFQQCEIPCNIAVFTHATNPKEIEQMCKDMPVRVVSTQFGYHFSPYVKMWLKREYNQGMNEYENLKQAWHYLVTQIVRFDRNYNTELSLTMDDYLNDSKNIYKKLGIAPGHSELWLDNYLKKNSFFNIVETNSTAHKLQKLCDSLESVKNFSSLSKQKFCMLIGQNLTDNVNNYENIHKQAKDRLGLYTNKALTNA